MRPCVPLANDVIGRKAAPGEAEPGAAGRGHLEMPAGKGDGRPGGSRSLGVSVHVTHPCFPEKMAFVGFKGSFRPTWVTLDTEDHGAKIFQVVPIPVVRKKKL